MLSLVSLTIMMPAYELFLPLDILFYTFRVIRYVADVFKGKLPVEKNFLDFARFIGFFSQFAPILLEEQVG